MEENAGGGEEMGRERGEGGMARHGFSLAVDSHRRPNGLLHDDLCKKNHLGS